MFDVVLCISVLYEWFPFWTVSCWLGWVQFIEFALGWVSQMLGRVGSGHRKWTGGQLWFGRNRRREKQCKAREEAERQRHATSLNTEDELRRSLRRVDSDYNHQRLRDHWARNLQQMLNKASAPESQWWTQYLLIANVRTANYMLYCCGLIYHVLTRLNPLLSLHMAEEHCYSNAK